MNPLAAVTSMASVGGAVGALVFAVTEFRAGDHLWGLYLLGLAIALSLLAQRIFGNITGERGG